MCFILNVHGSMRLNVDIKCPWIKVQLYLLWKIRCTPCSNNCLKVVSRNLAAVASWILLTYLLIGKLLTFQKNLRIWNCIVIVATQAISSGPGRNERIWRRHNFVSGKWSSLIITNVPDKNSPWLRLHFVWTCNSPLYSFACTGSDIIGLMVTQSNHLECREVFGWSKCVGVTSRAEGTSTVYTYSKVKYALPKNPFKWNFELLYTLDLPFPEGNLQQMGKNGSEDNAVTSSKCKALVEKHKHRNVTYV